MVMNGFRGQKRAPLAIANYNSNTWNGYVENVHFRQLQNRRLFCPWHLLNCDIEYCGIAWYTKYGQIYTFLGYAHLIISF